MRSGRYPNTFVSMWDVNGIRFLGNRFINEVYLGGYWNWGKGITSIDASYKVLPYITKTNNKINNEFRGLYYGIDASATNEFNTIEIDGNSFKSNVTSIYMKGMRGTKLTNNDFDNTDGIDMYDCNAYTIESNNFLCSNKLQPYCVGLQIYTSYPNEETNNFYNNTFTDQNFASKLMGYNDGGSNIGNGLKITCNDFFKSRIADIQFDYPPGASRMQGGMSFPARNRFDGCTNNTYPPIHAEIIPHTKSKTLSYYHNDPKKNPETKLSDGCYNKDRIYLFNTNLPFDKITDCPPTPSNSGGIVTWKQNIASSQTAINDLKQQLDGGGKTEELTALVNQYPAVSAKQIKTTLLQASPLSTPILIAAIQKNDPLPEKELTDILKHNCPLNEEILTALLYRKYPLPSNNLKEFLIKSRPLSDSILYIIIHLSPSLSDKDLKNIMKKNVPLSEFIWNELVNKQPPVDKKILNEIWKEWHENDEDDEEDDEGEEEELRKGDIREQVESDINYHISEIELSKNGLISDFIQNDTLPDALDSAIAILEQESSLDRKTSLVSAYLKKGDVVKAQQLVDSLEQYPELNNFCALQQILIDMQQSGDNFFTLLATNSVARQKIEQIAADTTTKGNMQARVILALVDSIPIPQVKGIFEENSILIAKWDYAELNNSYHDNETETDNNYKLSNYPNPFNDNTIITIKTPKEGKLFIYDVTGRILKNYNVQDGYNTITVGKNDLEKGIYFYSLVIDDLKVATRKMISLY